MKDHLQKFYENCLIIVRVSIHRCHLYVQQSPPRNKLNCPFLNRRNLLRNPCHNRTAHLQRSRSPPRRPLLFPLAPLVLLSLHHHNLMAALHLLLHRMARAFDVMRASIRITWRCIRSCRLAIALRQLIGFAAFTLITPLSGTRFTTQFVCST